MTPLPDAFLARLAAVQCREDAVSVAELLREENARLRAAVERLVEAVRPILGIRWRLDAKIPETDATDGAREAGGKP